MHTNGTDFHTFLSETAVFLSQQKRLDYFRATLPDALDERLAVIVQRYLAAAPSQRQQFLAQFDRQQRTLLALFGHRAATLAMRRQERAWLRWGLLGAALANYDTAERRGIAISLAIYHHVARQLGVNTVDLFDEIADCVQGDLAPLLRQFGRRSDIRLAQFGWRELNTADGVRYKFDWG
jgi:hypothetical protein